MLVVRPEDLAGERLAASLLRMGTVTKVAAELVLPPEPRQACQCMRKEMSRQSSRGQLGRIC